jgi:hypothetical protein
MKPEANFCPAGFEGQLPDGYKCQPPQDTHWDKLPPSEATRIPDLPLAQANLDGNIAALQKSRKQLDEHIFWLSIATTVAVSLSLFQHSLPELPSMLVLASIAYISILTWRSRTHHQAKDALLSRKAEIELANSAWKSFYLDQNGGQWQRLRTEQSFWQTCTREERSANPKWCGDEFARRVASLVTGFGWDTAVTIGNIGDYGVDIMAYDNIRRHRIVLQCKLIEKLEPSVARDLAFTKCQFGAHRAILVSLNDPPTGSKQFPLLRDEYGLEYWSIKDLSELGKALFELRKQGDLGYPDQDKRIQGPDTILECRFVEVQSNVSEAA